MTQHKPLLTKFFIFLFVIILYGCKKETIIEPTSNNTSTVTSPKLVSPSNESTLSDFNISIDWEDFNGSLSYQVQVSLDANFLGNLILDSNINTSVLNITTGLLATNYYYYWRVKSFQSTDTSSWSNPWRFRVILSPPSAPDLLLPPNNAVNVPFLPQFSWIATPTASAYQIQVSLNNNFNPNLIDSGRISALSFDAPLFIINTNTQYYWRVRASNSQGISVGPWSSVWNFTTIPGLRPNSANGRITFANNQFIPGGNYYVKAYSDWPPLNSAYSSDTLAIIQSGNIYYADYQVKSLPNGTYHLGTVYMTAGNSAEYYLGLYGCDTNRVQYSNCPNNPSTVQIQGNNGIENINFMSWADTSYQVIRFGR